MPTLSEQCDPRHPLKELGERIPWSDFEEAFGEYYSEEGRPAKPVRLMVGLLLLKQVYDQSDEEVVERWVENPYWQQFCGLSDFQWELPCDPSDLVYFRQRIGEQGVALILAVSAQLHGARAQEREVVGDSTVQEKNVTYPVDTKQYRKIHHAVLEACRQKRDPTAATLPQGGLGVHHGAAVAQGSTQAESCAPGSPELRTIAGALIRELKRKLPEALREEQRENFTLYRRVLAQKPQDTNKIYSLHEPRIYCVAKGKEHKKYEFGTKAWVAMTKTHGIIVAAVAHEKNLYDAHALPEILDQAEAMTDIRAKRAIVDRGYRGRKFVEGTEILMPGRAPRGQSRATSTAMRKRFRRRAAIEPLLCFKGFQGDQLNLMLAAAAWNFRKWMRLFIIFCFASSARSRPKTSVPRQRIT